MVLLDFDKELAQLVTATETGKIITRYGREVLITKWDGKNKRKPIEGKIKLGESDLAWSTKKTWTDEGKAESNQRNSNFDLFIEVSNDTYNE